MPTITLFKNNSRVADLDASPITPGAREMQPIGRGRYVPGRTELATITIRLSLTASMSFITEPTDAQYTILIEDGLVYELAGWQAKDGILQGHLAPLEAMLVDPGADGDGPARPPMAARGR